MKLQTKIHQRLQAHKTLGREEKEFYLLTPLFPTSGFRTAGALISMVLSHLVCATLLQQP